MAGAAVKVGYRRSVDLARFIAAFGIVWDHARAPYADIGYTALGLFLVLTSFLAVGSFERSDGKRFWLSRAQRIALPWLFWCVFFRLVFEVVSDEPFHLLSDPWTLLIGPSIHLWFLPFVMIFLVTIPWVSRFVDRPVRMYLAAALLVVVSVPLGLMHAELAPAAWFINPGTFPQPLPQWFFSLPLFWFGAILAVGKRMGLVWPVIVAAAVVSGILYYHSPEFASVQMILVAVVFEAIWRLNIKGSWPTWLAGFAFGIYLLHPATMLVAFKLFSETVDRSFAALFAFALAWVLTAALQRLPWVNRFL
ncbi:acyltransferase family protein [Cypionkella sp.]|uniref:acyltransferase family protein n=1 Tax=Cypionkella sp. TaxID=2811411 RepID=UPI002AB852CC|nr:acyltransferase family protein [Cypionkella sp.]MDZ4392099.1 acyltransferase family protein [Cypionkella sp.]